MIRAWRLCRAKYISAPLSGEGSRLYGGRWNQKGTRLVYMAGTLSLACMEALVYLDLSDLPADYSSVAIDIPNEVSKKILTPSDLPSDWSRMSGPDRLKRMGSSWVSSMGEAVLVVPSAVIPGELNVLVNLMHPDSSLIVVQPPSPFVFYQGLGTHKWSHL